MRAIFFLIVLLGIYAETHGQLAALFSKADKTSACSSWSAWGSCIWIHPLSSGGGGGQYLDQLTTRCKSHWFYRNITVEYKDALNNVFNYLRSLSSRTDRNPCGMCSYRQSCGYGGAKRCQYHPLRARRSIFPFYVAEQVCGVGRGLPTEQTKPCTVNYNALQGGGRPECQLWPPPPGRVRLPNISPAIRNVLYNIKWSNCVAARTRSGKVCKCCCFPYEPKYNRSRKRYVCSQIPGAPAAPGIRTRNRG